MPRGRKKKVDTKQVVTKKDLAKANKKIKDDEYMQWPMTSYRIRHKEWIDQYVTYLWTFRVPVFIYVWDLGEEKTREFFDEEWKKYWFKKWEFEYNCAGKTLSESWFGHLIWLKNYNITTLVHELLHVVQNRIRYCGIEMDDELQAYFLQWLMEQIITMDKEHNFKFYEPLPLDD